MDTAVDGNGTLANGLLVKSKKVGQSGKEEIAIGAMVVSRVNASCEQVERILEVGWVKWQFADGDGLKRRDSGRESGIRRESKALEILYKKMGPLRKVDVSKIRGFGDFGDTF